MCFCLTDVMRQYGSMTRVCVSGHSTKALTSLETSVLGSWESSTADFGLGTLFAHLETSRKFGDSLSSFRRNAEIVLGDSKVSFDLKYYKGMYR